MTCTDFCCYFKFVTAGQLSWLTEPIGKYIIQLSILCALPMTIIVLRSVSHEGLDEWVTLKQQHSAADVQKHRNFSLHLEWLSRATWCWGVFSVVLWWWVSVVSLGMYMCLSLPWFLFSYGCTLLCDWLPTWTCLLSVCFGVPLCFPSCFGRGPSQYLLLLLNLSFRLVKINNSTLTWCWNRVLPLSPPVSENLEWCAIFEDNLLSNYFGSLSCVQILW